MYFEDEKDIIDDNTDLHIAEDGTVSWDDILSEQNDFSADIVDDTQANVQDANTASEYGGVESIKNDYNPEEVEYISDPTNSSEASTGAQTAGSYTGEEYSTEENISDDFDIDKQLEQMSDSNVDESQEFEMPVRETKKSNSTVILLALLVALLVMGGVYYYFTQFPNAKDELVKMSTKTKMDNMTSEQLEERNAENAADEVTEQNGNADDASIPVISEENVEEVKAPEQPKDEKKQVISIIPTGRTNPFLPLQKYTKMDIDVNETVYRYDKVGIPTPPQAAVQPNPETIRMLSISVSGIMYDEQRPSAIITLDGNDYFVQKGDKLDNYRVVDIGRNYVSVAFGKNIYKANIGEEFKISTSFYGNAKYFTDGQTVGRQYYSISDSGDNKPAKKDNKTNESRYVSEDDVAIKLKEANNLGE